MNIETIGFMAAILSTIAFLPQTIKTIRTKDVEALSITSCITLFIGVSFWVLYGFLFNDMPILIANAIVLIFLIPVDIIKINSIIKKYKQKLE